MTGQQQPQQHRIAERIKGRQIAHDVAELIDWATASDEFREAFLDTLSPKKPEPFVAPKESLASLGETIMPFGMYTGQPISDVPIDYLQWLVAEQESLHQRIAAYCRHPDIWRQIDAEEIL